MRALISVAAAVSLVSLAGLVTACAALENRTGGGQDEAGAPAASDAGTEAGVQGAYCGAERQTGITLCAATSMCPDLVIDTQAMPSCGFRIRGSAVDLVCGCGEEVCPMGIFANCAQAAQLIANQSEGQVCAQVSEGRCTAATNTTSSSSTSSSSGGNGTTPCDKQCYAECGGGAGCASVCNCQ